MSNLLKDKNGKWAENLPISEQLWRQVMRETLHGVIAMLDSANNLLKNNGDMRIVAGLYTFALEEYGKLLLLNQYKPSNGNVIVKYRNEFRSHDAKFDIALKILPDECKVLRQGSFSSKSYSPASFSTDQIADFEARLAIFYSDFTPSANGIISLPSVDKKLLEKAIFELKNVTLKFKIP